MVTFMNRLWDWKFRFVLRISKNRHLPVLGKFGSKTLSSRATIFPHSRMRAIYWQIFPIKLSTYLKQGTHIESEKKSIMNQLDKLARVGCVVYRPCKEEIVCMYEGVKNIGKGCTRAKILLQHVLSLGIRIAIHNSVYSEYLHTTIHIYSGV